MNRMNFVLHGLITTGFFVALVGMGQAAASTDDGLRAMARCITQAGARFYGGYWSAETNQQKELFGAAADQLPYIECYNTQTQAKLTVCRAITTVPTWTWRGGGTTTGVQSLSELATATGCSLQE